ncbi:metallophosphoesterase family protein [Solibacillus sp. FSL H8-0538]|uniref:metallophosphoesterase family protein n=1 Tax=Solibacillus sp. FSL H8-0538 TaxID=2921400 RepID=UPI0030FB23F4
MNIDYISDLHLDFYVKREGSQEKFEQKTFRFLEGLLPIELGDVLVIAGDISHFNAQSGLTLKYFSSRYKHVLFVLGNHDYYLTSTKQERKYHQNSHERALELLQMIERLPNVTLLQKFEKVTVEGITFAGATNWYSLEDFADLQYFRTVSNDSVMIQGMELAHEHTEEQNHYRTLDEVDVCITHVPPLLINSHKRYSTTSCYLNELKVIKAPHYIFGHCHEQNIYQKADIHFYINALGYPSEQLIQQIRSFTLI